MVLVALLTKMQRCDNISSETFPRRIKCNRYKTLHFSYEGYVMVLVALLTKMQRCDNVTSETFTRRFYMQTPY